MTASAPRRYEPVVVEQCGRSGASFRLLKHRFAPAERVLMADFLISLLAGVVASILFDLSFAEIAVLGVLLCFWRWFSAAPRSRPYGAIMGPFRYGVEALCIALAFVVPVVHSSLPAAVGPRAAAVASRRIQPSPDCGHAGARTVWRTPPIRSGSISKAFTFSFNPHMLRLTSPVWALCWRGTSAWQRLDWRVAATGGMCAALLWMMYGLFPPRWALLGGILAVLRWGACPTG